MKATLINHFPRQQPETGPVRFYRRKNGRFDRPGSGEPGDLQRPALIQVGQDDSPCVVGAIQHIGDHVALFSCPDDPHRFHAACPCHGSVRN